MAQTTTGQQLSTVAGNFFFFGLLEVAADSRDRW
jgi:hypothetical protein